MNFCKFVYSNNLIHSCSLSLSCALQQIPNHKLFLSNHCVSIQLVVSFGEYNVSDGQSDRQRMDGLECEWVSVTVGGRRNVFAA